MKLFREMAANLQLYRNGTLMVWMGTWKLTDVHVLWEFPTACMF